MAKDKIHDSFKIALENEGWLVTNDPFFIKIGKIPILIDLGAEKFYAAEKENQKIAIEVKTFGLTSFITALYEAIGKFIVYRKALEVLKPNRTLYLAIPSDVYTKMTKEVILQKVIDDEKIKLVLYDTELEKITSWIK
ncbi:MAG: fatty-acid oxidation protein subunit alpha [Saprospiraceae bacterium]|nr:fatty-acid oxidation protein subunit alpha [Saprospiraceae bacterium]